MYVHIYIYIYIPDPPIPAARLIFIFQLFVPCFSSTLGDPEVEGWDNCFGLIYVYIYIYIYIYV